MNRHLFYLVVLTMALLSCTNGSKDMNHKFMTGAYADHRALNEDDRKLFEQTYMYKTKLTPQSVATQVVAGMNYSFICTDDSGNEVKVVIFKPLPDHGSPKVTMVEPITQYDEIVSYVRKGLDNGWKTMSPGDIGLSSVYGYHTSAFGFARKDINDDGIVELLLGESMGHTGNDEYVIYDFFTFDSDNGNVKHLCSGGERDRFTFYTRGIIKEEGSNSAFDSFAQYYELKNNKMVKIEPDTVADDRMGIDLEPFKMP